MINQYYPSRESLPSVVCFKKILKNEFEQDLAPGPSPAKYFIDLLRISSPVILLLLNHKQITYALKSCNLTDLQVETQSKRMDRNFRYHSTFPIQTYERSNKTETHSTLS